MTDPPLNTSPEAVRLRKAATDWGKHIDEESDDYDDKPGERRNRELLSAALAYANAVFHARPVIKSEDRAPKKKSNHAEPVGYTSNDTPVRWECTLCGRDKFVRRTAHTCLGQYRKKHLKWRPIYGQPDSADAP